MICIVFLLGYSVTLLHLGSEKSDGIDHSGARPLAREAISLLI
jgi:hypothetical protein